MLVASAVAFAAFCLCSSGIYFVNDVVDAELDRRHPVKRYRPVADGRLRPGTARLAGGAAIAAGLALSAVAGWELTVTVAAYVLLQLAYTYWLKNEAIVDMAAIAGGFLLRALGGGVASDIRLSQWFILAASFGSLFMAAGKRYAEIEDKTIPVGSTRASLLRYSPTYIRFVWTLSAGVLIMTYGLSAFDESADLDSPLPVVSMAPFVLAVLRYALHVDAGNAAEPETIALGDRWLQVMALVWVALVAWPLFLPG